MDLRNIFTRDLFADHDLTSVYLYTLLDAQPKPSYVLKGNESIELKPYEVVISFERAEQDLQMSKDRFVDRLSVLKKLKKANYKLFDNCVVILFTDICFPINPVIEKTEFNKVLASTTFKKWTDEYLQFIKSKIATKQLSGRYLELIKKGHEYFDEIVHEKYLSEITLDDYGDFVILLRTHDLENRSINTYGKALNTSFNRAVVRGYLTKNPLTGRESLPEIDKQVILFRPREVEAIFTVSPVWLIHVIKFALLTAMRRNEIVFLKWSTINLEDDTFWIRHAEAFRPKMGKERMLGITNEIRSLLKEIRDHQRQNGFESDYVFLDDQGRKITPSRLSHATKEAVRASGLRDELHFHAFRRTAATDLYNKTKDIYMVMAVLGHSSMKTTLKYLGVQEDKLIEAMSKLTIEDYLPKRE